jgi:hypothetical protein
MAITKISCARLVPHDTTNSPNWKTQYNSQPTKMKHNQRLTFTRFRKIQTKQYDVSHQ